MKKYIQSRIILLSCIAIAPTAHAATLFQDTFNRPDSNDLNASTTGKSGSLGALDWTELNNGGDPSVVSGELRMGDPGAFTGWSTAYLGGHNFIDSAITVAGGFSITIDIRTASTSGGTRFVGFNVGNSLTDLSGWSSNNPTGFTSDFFFGYDPTGTQEVKIFTGGTQVYQQGINLTAGGELSVEFTGFANFDSGTTVSYNAFVDGSSVKTGTFNWSGTNENYLQLYSNIGNEEGYIDSFAVTTIPEPSAALLGGLGVLLLLRRRR